MAPSAPFRMPNQTWKLRFSFYVLALVALCSSVKAFAPHRCRSFRQSVGSFHLAERSLSIDPTVEENSNSEKPVLLDPKDPTVEVPRTMRQALHLFWLDARYHGPRWVAFSLALLLYARIALAEQPLALLTDGPIFLAAVLVWSVQEHFLHGKVLHSDWAWYGKRIHAEHHARPYYHVSMDPAPLLMGWLWGVHILLQLIMPNWAIALTATLGYACAGLFYEWTHYLVHTRVPFPRQSMWRKLKDHHMQHHLLDNRYWLSFSIPAVDSLFGTRPSVQEVRRSQREKEF